MASRSSNSSYVDDDGQVLYVVETPFKLFSQVSTITSALSGDITSTSKINEPPPYDPVNGVKSQKHAALRDRFTHLAEIKFNKISSSVMCYHGQEYETSKFLRKKGWRWGCLRRHRAFTDPDGLEYQWILGCRVPELVRRDAARTPVARFHRRCLGKKRRASLEIFPEGMHMVDLILVTFVYIQKIRDDAERRQL